MSDIEYLTDELIDRVTDAIGFRRHEYRVEADTWRPYCICGWTAEEALDMAAYDRHLAVEALEAALPGIIQQAKAEALREAALKYQWGGWAEQNPAVHADLASRRRQAEHAVAWLRTRADHEQGAQP